MFDRSEVAAKIRKVLIEALSLNLTEEELRNRDRVDDLFGIDSMTMLEFVTALEKEFGITIDPDHLNFDTLTDLARLADYITSTQAAEGSAGPDAASAPS